MLTQYIWEDGSEKNLHYGIYRDEQLTKAISEVDMGYNRKASGVMEAGVYYLKHTGELDLYPSNKVLNPCCISYRRIYD